MEKEFILTITGTEHGDWQGKLKVNSDSTKEVNSLLQLIEHISSELELNEKINL